MHADSPVQVSTPVLADSPVLVNTPVLADSAIPVNVSSLADIELPCNWTKCHSDSGIIFSKIQTTSSKGSVVTHTLTIQDDNSWTLHVLGRKLDARQYDVLKEYFPFVDRNKVRNLLDVVARLHICPGHPDSHFVGMIKAAARGKGSTILDDYCDVSIDGQTYNITVRHVNCNIVVGGPTRCRTCAAYRSTMRALYSRYIKQGCNPHQSSPSSHTNLRYLRTPERKKRFKSMKARAKAASRKASRLRIRMEVNAGGVQLDEQLGQDMSAMMDECSGYVEPANSFERLFWEEQKQARQVKNAKQMRWHPMIIKWCLRMKLISSAAYSAFRSSGLLKLPSERTLRDYTHWMKAKTGFQVEVDQQLIEEAKLDSIPDFQKYVCLVFDEVKIKEGLVYDKEECQLIGFVDLDDVSNHLQAFERTLTDPTSKPILATHMVVFMVRGLFSSLRFPYAQFPCSTLNGHTLYALVWECISHLETIGLKVLALTADGASCNRKFFKMHGRTSFKTANICADEDRPIFFFSDPPHLMKTTRNCWANSFSHSYTRKLWVSSTRKE